MKHSIYSGLTCSKYLLAPENWANNKDLDLTRFYAVFLPKTAAIITG